MTEAWVSERVAGMPLVVDTAPVRLWFTPELAYLLVRQNLDDGVGVAMRKAFNDHVDVVGPPQFVLIDLHLSKPIDSPAARVKQAQWTKANLRRVRQGVAYVGGSTVTAFVARAIARMVGMPNVAILVDEGAVVDAVAHFRRGEALPDVPIGATDG